MKQLCLLFFGLCLLSATSMSAIDIEETFKSAPKHALLLLDKNARLDLLDLYNYNMCAEVENSFGGRTAMMAKSADSITLQLTRVSTWSLHLLPQKGDTILRCIHSLEKPIFQSDTTFYTEKWQKIENN